MRRVAEDTDRICYPMIHGYQSNQIVFFYLKLLSVFCYMKSHKQYFRIGLSFGLSQKSPRLNISVFSLNFKIQFYFLALIFLAGLNSLRTDIILLNLSNPISLRSLLPPSTTPFGSSETKRKQHLYIYMAYIETCFKDYKFEIRECKKCGQLSHKKKSW